MTGRAGPRFLDLPMAIPQHGRDRAVENWLHNQVGPAYDTLKADPSRAGTIEQIRARLAAEHAKIR